MPDTSRRQPRKPRPPLTRDEILDAGLALLRAGGPSGLSMRKLAAVLGVSPMSLYVHVGNKEALCDALVGRVLAGLRADPGKGGAWTEQVRRWAHTLRAELLAEPGMLELLAGRRWASVEAADPLLEVLRGAGFSTREAVRVCRLLLRFTLGFTVVQTGWTGDDGATSTATPADRGADARALYAHMEGVAPPVLPPRATPAELDDVFGYGIDLFVRGLAADLESQRKTQQGDAGTTEPRKRSDSSKSAKSSNASKSAKSSNASKSAKSSKATEPAGPAKPTGPAKSAAPAKERS